MSGYLATVERWQQLREMVQRLQAEERELREALFNGSFKDPQEGANRLPFPDGRVLVGTYKINRTIDTEAYKANWTKICREAEIPTNVASRIIKFKWNLAVGDYKKLLNDEQRKHVDTVLTIKPGLPDLELIPLKSEE